MNGTFHFFWNSVKVTAQICQGWCSSYLRNIPSKMIIHQKSSINQQEHYPESTIPSRSGYGSICHHLLFLIHSCCAIPFLSITVCPRARHGMSPPRVVCFFSSVCVCVCSFLSCGVTEAKASSGYSGGMEGCENEPAFLPFITFPLHSKFPSLFFLLFIWWLEHLMGESCFTALSIVFYKKNFSPN